MAMNRKKKDSKIHKFIKEAFISLMFIVFIISIAAMDSESLWLPIIGLGVSFTCLWVAAWKNGHIYGMKDGADDVLD